MFFNHLLIFTSKLTLSKNLSVILSVSNSLDPDLTRPAVGPDPGPNCLEGLAADEKTNTGYAKLSPEPRYTCILFLENCEDPDQMASDEAI